jgi:hypothetical protein
VRPRVEILIDELILHGFSPAERYAIGDSLSQELERLILDQGYQARENVEIPVFKTAPIKLHPDAKSDTIGTQVAQAVYGGLKR